MNAYQSSSADEDLLTTQEVALICRAPLSTVRYWRHIGAGPISFRLGRRVVYRRSDVHSWIHSQLDAQAAGLRTQKS